MGSRQHVRSYRVVDAALVRATVHPGEPVTRSWPNLGDDAQVEEWCAWLAEVWACPSVAEAVTVASPMLAARLQELFAGRRPRAAQVRRMVMSVARYLVRMRGRATPFGVFAGVAPLRFGAETSETLARRHVMRARADARWLAEVITELESCAGVRRRLPIVVNELVAARGERVLVPWSPSASLAGHSAAARVSVRRSRAVEAVLEAARAPIGGSV